MIDFFTSPASSLLYVLIAGFTISVIIQPITIRVSESFGLTDKPGGRKIHHKPISRLGGIGVFAGLIVTLIGVVDLGNFLPLSILIGIGITFLGGLVDDLKDLKPWQKLLFQIFAASLICMEGIRINTFQGILGLQEIPVSFQYAISILLVVGIINAYNLIDGIDGLAGGISAMACFIYGSLFYSNGELEYAYLAFSLAGAIMGFLAFNYHPAKIFLGDGGAMLIGFIIALFTLKALKGEGPTNTTLLQPWQVYAILVVPLADTLRVFWDRIRRKRSPFSAEKNHIHHILISYTIGHRVSGAILIIGNLWLVLLSLSNPDIPNWLGIPMVTAGFWSILLIIRSLEWVKFIRLKKELKKPQQSSQIKFNPFFHQKVR